MDNNFVVRGNLALEQRQYANASAYFDQALNQDAKCAEAYIGQFLAQSQCVSFDEFIALRLRLTAQAQGVVQPIQTNIGHIHEMAEKYALEPFLPQQAIYQMYQSNFTFYSTVAARTAQRRQEEQFWTSNALLNWAKQFADGETAEKLQQATSALLAGFDQRVANAQTEEATAQQAQLAAYDAFLRDCDQKVIAANAAAVQTRENLYLENSQALENPSIGKLNAAISALNRLDGYQNSRELIEKYQKKIQELKQKNAAITKKIVIWSVAGLLAIALIVTAILTLPNAIRYGKAQNLMDKGDYKSAAKIFDDLDDYRDASDLEEDCLNQLDYDKAIQLFEQDNPEEALPIFTELGRFKDSPEMARRCQARISEKIEEEKEAERLRQEQLQLELQQETYMEAEYAYSIGLKQKAYALYKEVGDYLDAPVKAEQIRKELTQTTRKTISTGERLTVALKKDGTVVAVGDNNHGECDVSDWKDIVSVSTAFRHTVGLKADGTVVAVGNNDKNQCHVSGWTDIVAIAAGYNYTLGLKADGTVVGVGSSSAVGKTSGLSVDDWKDIVAIDAGNNHSVGLKSDGTVVAVGSNTNGQCEVSQWKDIIAIAAGYDFTIGLKADGTVVATTYIGSFDKGQCDVSGWTDIVAISAGSYHTVGIKSDGTVVSTKYTWDEDYYHDQCNVSGWTDIVAIDASYGHTVGVKADGTVMFVGWNEYNQGNVSGWKDIGIPQQSGTPNETAEEKTD